MRLRDLLKIPSKGDAYKDAQTLDALDAYVMSKRSPTEGKLKALARMDELLGLEPPANPEHALKVYLATRAEDFVSDVH